MGNGQSQARHNYGGPLFGGHYPGDFSIRKSYPNVDKPLPRVPTTKSVRFGATPPAWEFYRDAPSWDNTANTRYTTPASSLFSGTSSGSPPPVYTSRSTNQRGPFYVWNR